ncbi:glycosyl transferase [filamentous cyanobacterium CCP5]|nr:glycosyl transferase [filamentous cyanobacterium CCP5]
MISVVLPCVNELRHGYLPQILENLSRQRGNPELIAVLSPSQDGTAQLIRQYPQVNLIEADCSNRAQRFNQGLQASHGEVVLLHHPATLLPSHGAIDLVDKATAAGALWGGFGHSFDHDHWLLRFTSWYSTAVRSRWSRILYFDHCLFARRDLLLRVGGVPDLDIFEDTALSQRLRSLAPPCILPATAVTSARRFRQRGIYQQALLNQGLKLLYHARLDPAWLNRLYEQRSQINVSYDDNG